MSRREIMHCPVGEMKDMIACAQIAAGATPRKYADMDDLMNVR